MTYNDIYNVLVNFLQEFKKEIKKEHDYITNHINNIDNAHTVNGMVGEMDSYNYNALNDNSISDTADKLLKTLVELCNNQYQHPSTHSADMIETNPGRRFVTETQLSEFSNKVGEVYVDNKITELHKNVEIEIGNKLENIINMRKVTDNLEAINAILESEETLFNLISLCSSKIGKEQFESHENNGRHLSDKEYTILNLIKEFIDNGGIDWNANTDNGLQAIKNKPDKLPADGGNADTISGRNIEELLNGKKTSTIIIGKAGYNYTKDMCDYWCDGTNDEEIIQNAVNKLINNIGGEIYIREGEYNITNKININRDKNINGSIIIKGCGNATILNFSNNVSLYLYNNIEINRVCINNCIINMNNSIEFNDSKLENCNITISESMNSISNSDIISSSITFGDGSINNMISNNRFIKSSLPLFNGNKVTDYDSILQGHVHFEMFEEGKNTSFYTLRAVGMAYGNDPIDTASYVILKEKRNNQGFDIQKVLERFFRYRNFSNLL